MSGYRIYTGADLDESKKLIPEEKKDSKHDTRNDDVSKHGSKVKVLKPEEHRDEDASHGHSHPLSNPLSGLIAGINNLLNPTKETAKDFENTLQDDKSLEEFHAQVKLLIKEISDKKKDGRLIKFNRVIQLIEHAVRVKIDAKNDLITELKPTSIKIKIKLSRVSKFQAEQKSFIEESNKNIKASELTLIEETKKELYNQLKTIIAHPIWDAQVRMYGGKVVSNADNIPVRVPTGIEQMMRVVTNTTLPKSKSCCHFRFFSKTIPCSRVKAQKEEELTAEEAVKKIKKIKKIAINRLLKSAKRTDPTMQFYTAIQSIDLTSLNDLKALDRYINTIKTIKGEDGILYFKSTGDEANTELVRLASSLSLAKMAV